MKIYRVVVRGHFADLDEATIVRLRSEADDHHYLKSAFTKDGTLTYDEQLVAFNLRYEMRFTDDDDGECSVESEALAMAARRLEREGFGFKRLTVTATDMASMWA